MNTNYFHRVTRETPTRLWINNPTGEEMEWAISAGAISCTTNPAYCARLVAGEPGYIQSLIDETLSKAGSNDEVAEIVYHSAARRLVERFSTLYSESDGKWGFVTVQGDPRHDDDAANIVSEGLRARQVGANVMVKIPATRAGTEAMAELVAMDVPICATEVFALAQVIYLCELYSKVAAKSGKHPPFYVTHITGIFDQYLAELVKREGIKIAPEILSQAGCIVARKEYKLLKERNYPGVMLGGGARGTQHFTEMVGGDAHVTINWSTAKELITMDGPTVMRIDSPATPEIVEELAEKLPDWRRAYQEDGLTLDEFKDFGPLVLFRSNFLAGYGRLLEEVSSRRANITQQKVNG